MSVTLIMVASEALKRMTLEVHDTGISYNESSGFGKGQWSHHAFADIDAIVRSTVPPVLSIQVGTVIYSLPYKEDSENHRAVIAALVDGARRAGVV